MSEQVIEPSEIILETTTKPKEDITHVNPWLRCIARFFDYALFCLFLLSTRKLFHGRLPFGPYEHLIPFEFFVWIPIEALLLRTWGTTPGKFFLKTKLQQGKKGRLDFMTALRRSFSVWFRGLGMRIPCVDFFCLLIAYHKLKVFQTTSWDRDDHIVVTHYPIKKWRLYLAVFVAVAGNLYYYSEKNAELKHASRSLVRSFDESPLPTLVATRPSLSAQNSGSGRSD